MSKKYRSARGDLVDFDLLKLKKNLSAKPTTTSVLAREQYVDGKLKHRHRRKQMPPLPQSLIDNIGKKRVNEQELAENIEPTKTEGTTKPKTQQKARPKVQPKTKTEKETEKGDENEHSESTT